MSHRIYTEFKDLNTHFDDRNFFVSKNLLLLGNTDGWFSNEFDWAYNSVSGERWYKGLHYRIKNDYTLKTFIVGDSETIDFYKNLFSKWELDINKDYDFPNTNKNICFVTIDEWSSDRKTNIFERYINYVKETGVHFNHIIANPPYGKIGSQVISTLTSLDYDDCVCLAEVSDFKTNELYKNVSDAKYFFSKNGDSFFDATISALTLVKLNKKKNNISYMEYVCSRDSFLSDWHKRNIKRNATYSVYASIFRRSRCGKKDHGAAFDPDSFSLYDENFYQSSLIFNMRFVNDIIHKSDGDAVDIKWNQNIPDYKTFCDIILNTKKEDGSYRYRPDAHCLKLNTHKEKVNLWKWMSQGKLYTILNEKLSSNGSIDILREVTIPHVDWTKEWTDEEILKDYGYTDEEIKELLK